MSPTTLGKDSLSLASSFIYFLTFGEPQRSNERLNLFVVVTLTQMVFALPHERNTQHLLDTGSSVISLTGERHETRPTLHMLYAKCSSMVVKSKRRLNSYWVLQTRVNPGGLLFLK